jgi:cobalt/nickel transport system permease protein
LACGLAVSAGVLALSGLPVPFVLRRLRSPAWLLLFMTAALVLTAGGEELGRVGPVAVSRDGLVLGLTITARAVGVLTLFVVLLESTPLATSIRALSALRVPPKLVAIIFFAVRFMYLYVDDLRRMRTALTLRGYGRAGPLRGIATNAGVVGSLLVRSFEHADRIDGAMRLRGFSGELPSAGHFQARSADYLKTLLSVMTAGALLAADRLAGGWGIL